MREVETGAAIYETNRIVAAKAKKAVRKSQELPILNITAHPHPTLSHYQYIFHARIVLNSHLRSQCTNRPTTVIAALTTAPAPTPTSTTSAPTFAKVAPNPSASLPTTTATSVIFVTIIASKTNTTSSSTAATYQSTPDVPTTANTFTITIRISSDVHSVQTCPN
ncbi:hypothetical protein SprV_0200939000 [Sparganum proliferum]